MALSQKKKDKIEAARVHAERKAYVDSCTGSFGIFLETNWDAAAREYLRTGDESLKAKFPGPRPENQK